MNLINAENHRKTVYPITNSFYHIENGCKMGNPPTEEVRIIIENIKPIKKASFLDEILKLFEED